MIFVQKPSPSATERDVERACDALIASLGGDVIRTSPPGRTRQHVGLPDRRYRLKGRAWYFEVKRDGGKLTASQLAFLRAELACDALALCGTLEELAGLTRRIAQGVPSASLAGYCAETVEAWAARGLRREAA